MSTVVKTLKGESFEAGFNNINTSEIMLGELATIGFDEFSRYAAEAAIECIPFMSPARREVCRASVDYVRRKVINLPIDTAVTSDAYNENPFSVGEGIVSIGNRYEILPELFFEFAMHYIGGGWSGWQEVGYAPASAVKAIEDIQTALRDQTARV